MICFFYAIQVNFIFVQVFCNKKEDHRISYKVFIFLPEIALYSSMSIKSSILPIKGMLFIGLLFLSIHSCVPPNERQAISMGASYNNPEVRKILQFQDSQKTDSLLPYLQSKSTLLRYHATKAFASMKINNTSDHLIKLLKDPDLEVRAMAAFSLGQIGNEKSETALISAFTGRDSLGVNNIYNQNILEALGKCGSKTTLKNIASVVSYRVTDHLLLLGQMRSIYRFGLRNIFDNAGTQTALNYVVNSAYPEKVRIIAANYLSRFKEASIDGLNDKILPILESDDNPNIRMALANAAGRGGNNGAYLKKLISINDQEKDYRVRCNITRSLSNFEFDSIKSHVFKLINDPNLHVAGLASEIIGKKGIKEELYVYKGLINETQDWKIKTKLYQSLFKASPVFYSKFKNELAAEMMPKLYASTNPYEKAEYIKALGHDPYQYINIANLMSRATSSVEKNAIIDALGNILIHPDFVKAYGSKFGEVKYYILNFMKNQCLTGDVGLISSAAVYLKKPDIVAKEFIRDSSWIENTKAKLKLPRDIEAYNEILQVQSMFTDSTYESYKVPFNHNIDFRELEINGDSIKIVMKTTKGNITMLLFSSLAPGSVSNFIKLCTSDFYDNKIFHRVVPNFVIQAGCPRGDGFGSLDYTIRSEFDQIYYDREGYIGMASAGNHTEGTQFFITHSPTPHLDGRYTIFGKVLEGMDVVHAIHVGDKIIDAIILK